MSLEPLAPGELATLVTWLEMRDRPAVEALPSHLRLEWLERPDPASYRRLFRRVGAPWLWFSRLAMNDEELERILHDPAVEVRAVLDPAGAQAGLLELDFRKPGECELAFVGLVPELTGKGHGRWLLAEALRLAWKAEVSRVHVHSCAFDHPSALRAYMRAGFRPVARAVERFADPRLAGLLPPDCAPQVPLLGTEVSTAPPALS